MLRHEADIPDSAPEVILTPLREFPLIDLIIYRTQYSNNSTGSANTIHNLLSKKHLSFVRLQLSL